MASKTWRIDQFWGINQSIDGSLLNEGTAADARNVDTSDGNLRVAKGTVKHFDEPVPGTGPVRRMAIMKAYNELIFAVIAGDENGDISLWSWDNSGGYGWVNGFSYPSEVQGRHWDILQCNIGDEDYLIFANGEHQMVKWDMVHRKAELFGSGETVLETTVASYNSTTKTVILTDEIDDLAKTRLEQAGIVIQELTYKVGEVTQESKSVVLDDTDKLPGTPAAGNEVEVKGGLSDASVNYIALHFSRLFSAGDPENPSRLYYSQLPGDGRTIEDWRQDDASANTSGGFVEVGDSFGDPIIGIKSMSTQLIIFKRYSVYRLLGDRPSNFTIERIDAEVELTAHSSVAMHGDIAFYLTPVGLYYYNNVTAIPMPDLRNIRRFMENAYVSQSKGCEAGDIMYFTCYKGDDPGREYDNHVLVYDINRRSYLVRDGIEIADLTSVDGKLYTVGPDRIVKRFNEGATYDGEDVNAYWYTQRTDNGAKSVLKQIREVYMRAVGDRLRFNTLSGTQKHTHDANITTEPEEILEIRPNIDKHRTFQFMIENLNGSFFEIQGGIEAYITSEDRPR